MSRCLGFARISVQKLRLLKAFFRLLSIWARLTLYLSVRQRRIILFSDQFRRGESEQGRFSGVRSSKLISNLSDVAWKLFQSVNKRLPEGEAIRPKWAPGPLLKSYERTSAPLGCPRATESLSPTCSKGV